MATREEVLARLEKSFELTQHHLDTYSLLMDFGPARVQQLIINLSDQELRILAPIAVSDEVEAEVLLTANDTSFGLVLNSGTYFLQHSVFLAAADSDTILFPLAALASESMELQSTLGFR